jgi:aldose 1-epimerase
LRNSNGVSATIITYGAAIVELGVPDRFGTIANVVLCHRNLAEYESAGGHYGATIGRFANRIAGGRYTLDGRAHQLSVNRPPNMLHGGFSGFDKKVWRVESVGSDGNDSSCVRLSLVSPDGDEGFPGWLDASVSFTLDDANALRLDYEASADVPTVVNFTNHSYFNLAGSEGIEKQELTIDADAYTPVDAALIPSGEIKSVAGTDLDFRKSRPIGDGAYDFNFVLNRNAGDLPSFAARASDPQSGRVLEVLTTEPGLQFYSAASVGAFALETQHFPDSPNHANFPSTVLRPGNVFRSTTVYRFTCE